MKYCGWYLHVCLHHSSSFHVDPSPVFYHSYNFKSGPSLVRVSTEIGGLALGSVCSLSKRFCSC